MLRGLKFYGFFTIISIKPKKRMWFGMHRRKNRRERF